MADRIEANYEALGQTQQKLAKLVDDVEQTEKHIGGKTATLCAEGWQGRGSDEFHAEMNDEIAPAIRKLREALETLSWDS